MMYVRFPLSLRNVEDLLFERGVDICHETVRLWWNRFGPMFHLAKWSLKSDRLSMGQISRRSMLMLNLSRPQWVECRLTAKGG